MGFWKAKEDVTLSSKGFNSVWKEPLFSCGCYGDFEKFTCKINLKIVGLRLRFGILWSRVMGLRTTDVSDVMFFLSFSVRAMRDLEKLLEETKVNETTSMSDERLVVVLHKQNGSFRGLKFSANETEVGIFLILGAALSSPHCFPMKYFDNYFTDWCEMCFSIHGYRW